MVLKLLNTASFRGVEFLVKSTSLTFGQRTVITELPNSNKTVIEYMGARGDEFAISAVIQGKGEEFFNKKNALIEALSKSGTGVFVHPTDGSMVVSVIGTPTEKQDFKELGVAKFDIVFKKTTATQYPIISNDNTSKISNTTDNILTITKQDISDNWDITADPYNFTIAQNKLTNVSDIFDTATKSIKATDSFISEMSEAIENFSENKIANAFSGSLLATAFTSLFNNADSFAQNASDQFNMLREFFNFGDNDKVISRVDTFASLQAIKNNGLIDNGMKFNSLALSYKNATDIDYKNNEDVNLIEQTLENQYRAIISNSISDDLRLNINTLRNEARIFFDRKREEVADIVTAEINGYGGLTPLIYRFYGDLSLTENIKGLNNIQDANYITGDLRVLTS